MPSPSLILLYSAAACQLLIVYLCIRQFVRLLVLREAASHAGIEMPATIVATTIQAAMFNCGLLVLAVPDLLKGEVSNGFLVLAGTGFLFVGVASFVISATTKTSFATLQLGLSVLGLVCLFLPHFLWGNA